MPPDDDHDHVVVLVPVKAFRDAKARLAPALDAAERAKLARAMATTVVRAAHDLPVAVVCDDDEVRAWAKAEGARVLWRPGLGLNGAVSDGVATLAAEGVARVVVAHADLPHADDLRVVAGGDGLLLVPDRHGDGTNVLALPAASGFVFAYGPGSFMRHRAEGERLDLDVRIVRSERLGWDVDTPADLGGAPIGAPTNEQSARSSPATLGSTNLAQHTAAPIRSCP